MLFLLFKCFDATQTVRRNEASSKLVDSSGNEVIYTQGVPILNLEHDTYYPD